MIENTSVWSLYFDGAHNSDEIGIGVKGVSLEGVPLDRSFKIESL